MRILIVDDEEMIRTLATKILQKAGHEVLTAESGREGVELVFRNPSMIDLVILDQTMPGLSGVDTLREIRKLSSQLPCVISSGNVMEFDELPAELRERTAILQKPYRSQNLLGIVSEVSTSVRSTGTV